MQQNHISPLQFTMIFLYFYEFRKGRKKKKEKLMWQSVPTRSGWSVPIEAARAAASTEADDTDRRAGGTKIILVHYNSQWFFYIFMNLEKGEKRKKKNWCGSPYRPGWSVPIEAARAAASTEADDTDRWAGSTAGHWSQPKTRAVVSSKPHHPSLFDSSHWQE
jgi:hypothetical protein